MIKVKSIEASIIGDGPFVGRAAVIIRVGECNLACSFCNADCWTGLEMLDEEQVVQRALAVADTAGMGDPLRFLITGGEPGLWDLDVVVDKLMAYKDKHGAWRRGQVIVETNGTLWMPWFSKCTGIVVSPKTEDRNLSTCQRAWAFVFPFGEGVDPLYKQVVSHRWFGAPCYIQPVRGEHFRENIRGALEYVMQHPRFALSLSVNKVLGLP